VSWTPPAWDGGSPVTHYVIRAMPGDIQIGVNASTLSVPLGGLVNGTPYTLTVDASNALDTSLWSYPSNVVVPLGGAGAPDAVSGSLGAGGGAVTTDPAAAGPTASDPIETTVAVPSGAGGGDVTIAESPASGSAPAGYQFLGQQVEITSTAGTTAANPLTLTFTLDASIVAGLAPAAIGVFRSEGGGAPVLVPDCGGPPGVASPDPCIASRAYVGGTGDVAIVVLTSHASVWNLAGPACQAAPVAPDPIQFTSPSILSWPAGGGGGIHFNTYRGTIPSQMLGSRLPGSVYDAACFESGDAAGDGAATSTDAALPAVGTAFFYLVSGESACAESPLGTTSSGQPIPNAAPCPTPP
jgi:hypothetical protein